MTGCQRNLTLCEPVQLSMPFPLQLWALTGTLTWTSESARRNCAWSASVCEIRRVSWAASLWASTPCPSPAWWKVSRARTKEWEQEGGWRRVTSGDKLHQGTLCDCVERLHTVSISEGCPCAFTSIQHASIWRLYLHFLSVLPQATAGYPFGHETDAASIQPPSSSLFGIPKNSPLSPARIHTKPTTKNTSKGAADEQKKKCTQLNQTQNILRYKYQIHFQKIDLPFSCRLFALLQRKSPEGSSGAECTQLSSEEISDAWYWFPFAGIIIDASGIIVVGLNKHKINYLF